MLVDENVDVTIFREFVSRRKYNISRVISRGVTRLDGNRGKKDVWRSHVRIRGLSEANVPLKKYLSHCCDFSAPP